VTSLRGTVAEITGPKQQKLQRVTQFGFQRRNSGQFCYDADTISVIANESYWRTDVNSGIATVYPDKTAGRWGQTGWSPSRRGRNGRTREDESWWWLQHLHRLTRDMYANWLMRQGMFCATRCRGSPSPWHAGLLERPAAAAADMELPFIFRRRRCSMQCALLYNKAFSFAECLCPRCNYLRYNCTISMWSSHFAFVRCIEEMWCDHSLQRSYYPPIYRIGRGHYKMTGGVCLSVCLSVRRSNSRTERHRKPKIVATEAHHTVTRKPI